MSRPVLNDDEVIVWERGGPSPEAWVYTLDGDFRRPFDPAELERLRAGGRLVAHGTPEEAGVPVSTARPACVYTVEPAGP